MEEVMLEDLFVFAGFTKVEELPTYAKFIKAVVDWMQSKKPEQVSCSERIKSLELEGHWDWNDLSALRRYPKDERFPTALTPHMELGERCPIPYSSRLVKLSAQMIPAYSFERWINRLMLAYASVAYSDRSPQVHAPGSGKKDELYLLHYFYVDHDGADRMSVKSAGFKLGRSTDAQRRLRAIKTGAACLVVPLIVIKRAGDLEPLIHAAMKSVGLRDYDEFYRPKDLMLLLALIAVGIELIDSRPASQVIERQMLGLKYAPLSTDDGRFDNSQDYYDSYCLQGGLVYNRDDLKYHQVGIWNEDNLFHILWPYAHLPDDPNCNWGELSLAYERPYFKFFSTMPLVSLNLHLCAIKEARKELHRKYGSILQRQRLDEHFMIEAQSICKSIPACLLNSELEGIDMSAVYDMFYYRYDKD
jgi:hypothetical protein